MHKNKTLTKFFFVVLLVFLCNDGRAQADSMPIFKRFPTAPPFKLMLAPDSVAFTKENLTKRKSIIIMLFSPDCDHCIHATKELLKNIDLFKKTQIIMVTSLSYNHIQKFYTDFKIADYHNIKVGLDNTYFLGTFYGSKSYPSIYVYDKKGNFKKFFEGTVSWVEIAKAL